MSLCRLIVIINSFGDYVSGCMKSFLFFSFFLRLSGEVALMHLVHFSFFFFSSSPPFLNLHPLGTPLEDCMSMAAVMVFLSFEFLQN